MGLTADIDFYCGVFFHLIRTRSGGHFHSAIVTISGTLDPGNGFFGGNDDSFFLDIGGTTLGVSVSSFDTVTTVAQRFVNGINNTFVGVWALVTGTGQLTITTLSPINGFTLSSSYTTFLGATLTVSGDILAGNEGIWSVDSTQTSPLNKGFFDWITDFCNIIKIIGLNMYSIFIR